MLRTDGVGVPDDPFHPVPRYAKHVRVVEEFTSAHLDDRVAWEVIVGEPYWPPELRKVKASRAKRRPTLPSLFDASFELPPARPTETVRDAGGRV